MPDWLTGALAVTDDLSLSYARLFIMGLAGVALCGVGWYLFRTNTGRLVRAVMQNRAMADCLGVRTDQVDATTFALGTGLAGLAGAALCLLGPVGPFIGTDYIVQAFMVVVLGGVGQLAGTVGAAAAIGGLDSVFNLAFSVSIGQVIVFAAGGRVPAVAAIGICADPLALMRRTAAGSRAAWCVLASSCLCCPRVLDPFRLNLLGKYLCYALVALGLDLLWGYAGQLSLGQSVFFGLGAYLFGMYLKLESSGGKLPDFMSWSGLTELPGVLAAVCQSGASRWSAAVLIPGVLGTALGYLLSRSRIVGVYFAIITQALAFIATTLFIGQQPFTGGTNGLTNFSTIFGQPLRDPEVQVRLFQVTTLALAACLALHAVAVAIALRATAGGAARRRAAGALQRLQPDPAAGGGLRRCRRHWLGWAARCSCRRSASSIPTRWASSWASRWSSGLRSADAAR